MIVEGAECICLKDYETVDHLIWHCKRFETERRCLTDALILLDVQLGTPARDLCARDAWNYNLMTWLSFSKDSWANITSDLGP
jgi:hypothetical protein